MNGIVQDHPDINKWWCLNRPAVLFVPVPKLMQDELSARQEEEAWLKQNLRFQKELNFLLSLEHHRFWSQILYDSRSMDRLVSFLQEALPYYALEEYLVTPKIENSYHETAKLVFSIFVRLGTYYEEYDDYLSREKQSNLILEHHIFTLPIMMDLCLIYGKDNSSIISKLISNIFQLQPRYINDIAQVILFVEEALKLLTYSFCGAAALRNNDGEPIPLTMGKDQILLADMKPEQCRDRLLYLLDTFATVTAFLDFYNPASYDFQNRHFHSRLAVFYHSAIPQLEKKIESIGTNDENVSLYVDLKNKLSLAKMEMLRLFKQISSSAVHYLIENREKLSADEVKEKVDEYVTMLIDCLSENIFMEDYHNVYGVDADLDAMTQISPDLDTIKYEYLVESIKTSFSSSRGQRVKAPCFGDQASSSFQPPSSVEEFSNDNAGGASLPTCQIEGVELESLISQVIDLLPDLGTGFVQRCLQHYNYHPDEVINAVLEGSLPDFLDKLDHSLPSIPPEVDNSVPKRHNVFDNDEFDIMTRDNVDLSKMHKGKRKTVPKNAFDLLNDKSEIAGFKEMYSKFGALDTGGSLYDKTNYNMYDDEYDDTYDNDVSTFEAGEIEQPSRRQFTIPRVLEKKGEEIEDDESSGGEEPAVQQQRPRDAFCENPEEARARRERQRSDRVQQKGSGWKRGEKSTNVVGTLPENDSSQLIANMATLLVLSHDGFKENLRDKVKKNKLLSTETIRTPTSLQGRTTTDVRARSINEIRA